MEGGVLRMQTCTSLLSQDSSASCCSSVSTGSQARASAFACSHSGFDMSKGLGNLRMDSVCCSWCCTCLMNGRNRVFIDVPFWKPPSFQAWEERKPLQRQALRLAPRRETFPDGDPLFSPRADPLAGESF